MPDATLIAVYMDVDGTPMIRTASDTMTRMEYRDGVVHDVNRQVYLFRNMTFNYSECTLHKDLNDYEYVLVGSKPGEHIIYALAYL